MPSWSHSFVRICFTRVFLFNLTELQVRLGKGIGDEQQQVTKFWNVRVLSCDKEVKRAEL